ncbi:MAG: L-aspartate oxidase [Lachnospiraceae bacterium]|nr:L-aspartate oxidase [Lachnospiraceae bacterium]
MSDENKIQTDYVIVGTGVSGLYCALNLPKDSNIIMITKDSMENSDSFLAQGGICVLVDEDDYDGYFNDTMNAGHNENNPETVEIMIRSSRRLIDDLVNYNVDFAMDNGKLLYTKEGAHGRPRILFHEDITGKEITSKLLAAVKKLSNVKMLEYTTMTDLIMDGNNCLGIVAKSNSGHIHSIYAKDVILASGGIGGLYEHSTNYRHLTGDSIELAKKYNIETEHLDYVQIHPTTLYSDKPGRRFLISESVRGEGAILLDKNMHRFCNELLPRDVVTAEIRKQMEKDHTKFVWLDMSPVPKDTILNHFPNIYRHCLECGYDVTKDPIPVVPAQHYFMGGIKVNTYSKTSADHLYAVGETACNGVHGKNRLASNSLLESMIFARRAAMDIQNIKLDITSGIVK